MPAKPSTTSGRGRAKGATSARMSTGSAPVSTNPFESSDDQASEGAMSDAVTEDLEEREEPDKTIPAELLTRILHEFFAKDATRISRDANAAVGKYVDVFVREAIARAAVEKKSGFLEVEDLEKIAPQLLLDL